MMAKLKLEDGTEIEAFTADEVKAKVEEEVSGLKAKVDDLLGESKSAKQKARELEESQAQAEEERLKEKQEFKTLFEREQESKRELTEKYESFRSQVEQKDIALAVGDLVSEATRDTSRAKALKKLLSEHAKFGEDGVYYEMGGVQVDKDKLLETYKTDYPFLFDGVDSSGGGAKGGNGGAIDKKPTDYTEQERVDLYKSDPDKFREIFKPN
jgi:hypothetical protein